MKPRRIFEFFNEPLGRDKFLHGADIVTVLEQMGGEAVLQRADLVDERMPALKKTRRLTA